MHARNEFVASVFQLKKGFTVDSGWTELVGWDFPEVADVASFASSKWQPFPDCLAKAGNPPSAESWGFHRLWFEGPLHRKENRP